MTKGVSTKTEASVGKIRKYLKEKLILDGQLHGYEEEKKQFYNIISRTVYFGESDSVLVVGPRGCGKSIFVSTCLEEFGENCKCRENYVIVKLHGLIHTDDNLALKDIIRQLHVEELGDGNAITGSFSDNLLFVLLSLKSGNREVSKSIIFILEEFQLFCGHRNQTLLYNLFDIAQSAQAPICVIGLTCRIDITEMLEKRVKSRFSHRQILLFPSNKYEDRIELIKCYLSIQEHPRAYRMFGKSAVASWNENILSVLKDNKIIQLVRKQLEVDANERKLKSWLMQVICKISETNPKITTELIAEILQKNCLDVKVELLKDLSVLELCMVIAMNHHNEIYDGEPFNFEMVVKQYLKFAHQNYSVQVTQRPILFKAFERLKNLELVIPLSHGIKSCKKEYQLYNLLVTSHQIKDAVASYQGVPTDVSQWANSSIV